jgi:hypothetical protein
MAALPRREARRGHSRFVPTSRARAGVHVRLRPSIARNAARGLVLTRSAGVRNARHEGAMPLRIENVVDGAVRVEVEDSFLPEDARRIHDLVDAAAPGTYVEIDFRRVRECREVALSELAKDMLGGRARIAALGLSHRHERLLGYLGVPLPPTPGVPEEQW